MCYRLLFALLTWALVTPLAHSQDWPQFRGPGGTAVITSKKLPPERWGPAENVAWKVKIPGEGWSSPVVAGGRVFVTSCVGSEKNTPPKTGYYAPESKKQPKGEQRWTVFCFDAATGNKLWERVAHKGVAQHPVHVKASYAPESPIADGDRVYAYFGNVGLFCFDKDGKELWNKSWGVMPTRLGWGTGGSPVLYKDRIYLVNDNEKASFIVALDKFSGKEIWKTARDEKTNWVTPFLWEHALRTEIVTCGSNKARSYDLDGKLLWELGGQSSISTPMPVAGPGLLYVSSGYEYGRPRPVFAVRPGASGDISLKKGDTKSDFIAWYKEPAGAYLPTPLVLGDKLYVLYSAGFISCFEAKSGKPLYERQRLEGFFTASPWSYGGKIFCLSEEGITYVLREGAKFDIVGRNDLKETALATPAIADGRLFVRTFSTLYCICKEGGVAPVAGDACVLGWRVGNPRL